MQVTLGGTIAKPIAHISAQQASYPIPNPYFYHAKPLTIIHSLSPSTPPSHSFLFFLLFLRICNTPPASQPVITDARPRLLADLETAEMAVQASLTGHMVYSTLHTNSALGTVTRLRDMGVENYLIASTLVGMIAQRLVRVLCPHCKVARSETAQELKVMGMTDKKNVRVYDAVGCEECAQTGYRGRVGIYEIVPRDESLRSVIQHNQSEAEMEALVRKKYPSMRQYGWSCVKVDVIFAYSLGWH